MNQNDSHEHVVSYPNMKGTFSSTKAHSQISVRTACSSREGAADENPEFLILECTNTFLFQWLWVNAAYQK